MWADSIPALLQARLIESLENYDIAHAPLRAANSAPADRQIVIDVRRFQIKMASGAIARMGLSARILDKNGKVVASRLFEQDQGLEQMVPAAAVDAFNAAFGRIATDMIAWTAEASR